LIRHSHQMRVCLVLNQLSTFSEGKKRHKGIYAL
jgi:hypothetical protein